MITVRICLVAEQILRDADTNTVSAINLTEGIVVQTFPVVVPRLQFMALWERDMSDPEDSRSSFTVTLDGQELGKADGQFSFARAKRTRTLVRLDGLVLPSAGTLVMKQVLEGGPEARYELRVEAATTSTPTYPPESPQPSQP